MNERNQSMKRRSRRIAELSSRKSCGCKVGTCTICASQCKRCVCACDRIDPFDAIQRTRSGKRKKIHTDKNGKVLGKDKELPVP